MELEEIKKLYKETFGIYPETLRKLPGAGSSRRYYIIEKSGDATDHIPLLVVATAGDNVAENRAFCEIAKAYAAHNVSASNNASEVKQKVNVPEIYAVSADGNYYLQSWHGAKSLMDYIKSKDENEQAMVNKLLKSSIDMLVDMQTVEDVPYADLVFNAPFNRRQILWDLNYFKYEFVKPCGLEFDEERLEDDFDALADDLISQIKNAPATVGFMYRDFQSRNILVDDEEKLTFIDFQGGRVGPIVYDIVSLLWQAKAAFPIDLRRELTEYYFSKVAEKRGEGVVEQLRAQQQLILIFRALQVLGAYGFRGLVERKAHFLESIVYGLDNLQLIVDTGYLDKYPYLRELCLNLIGLRQRFAPAPTGRLKIEVFSFSYKKGYPADYTGNGGGFMFDCRGMHNPGRYEEYKKLTGLDKPVIDFLEERGEVQRFVENCEKVVAPSVETYLRRGFSNLQIGFGCTGGQHRSVYCAQHLAERLAEKYTEADVILTHREQGIVREIIN